MGERPAWLPFGLSAEERGAGEDRIMEGAQPQPGMTPAAGQHLLQRTRPPGQVRFVRGGTKERATEEGHQGPTTSPSQGVSIKHPVGKGAGPARLRYLNPIHVRCATAPHAETCSKGALLGTGGSGYEGGGASRKPSTTPPSFTKKLHGNGKSLTGSNAKWAVPCERS